MVPYLQLLVASLPGKQTEKNPKALEYSLEFPPLFFKGPNLIHEVFTYSPKGHLWVASPEQLGCHHTHLRKWECGHRHLVPCARLHRFLICKLYGNSIDKHKSKGKRSRGRKLKQFGDESRQERRSRLIWKNLNTRCSKENMLKEMHWLHRRRKRRTGIYKK